MPLLLVTNDDGVHARGLGALAEAVADLGDVHVLAPEREQSACGHALTLHRPLRIVEVRDRWWAVNGTPSDCVNLAVLGFLPERPVLVLSGINHGSNLGDDVTYSGTVSAAMEGTLLGVPSIAVSLAEGGDWKAAAAVARLVATRTLVEGIPAKTLLNVNLPSSTPRGIRFARLGHRDSSEQIVAQTDPRGRTHYWIGGPPPREALEGTDIGAVHEGYVAVTPVHLDMTNYRALAQMESWQPALDAQYRRMDRAGGPDMPPGPPTLGGRRHSRRPPRPR